MNSAPKKGYKICYVYYSDNDGNIIKKKLTELINEDDIHVSIYYRRKNFKHPWLSNNQCNYCETRE